MVPVSAHSLFAKPLVVSPKSRITIEIPQDSTAGVLVADGRREFDLPVMSTIEVTKSDIDIPIARISNSAFTNRLVAKFQLPVAGWRGTK